MVSLGFTNRAGGWTIVAGRPTFTEDEYLALERASQVKHAFLGGVIIAMAGADPLHNLVCSNMIRAFGPLADRRGCVMLTSDQRVWVPATGAYVYPDVSGICGGIQRHARDAMTVVNPSVVVEVSSPSTELQDRGEKLLSYRTIESLEHYVACAAWNITDGSTRGDGS